ncbi:hypothetical protein THASP1DRAFT_30451 [Thamnocephalis sphaerospora]|uniref:Uncharacterized protein n=1 Tax=Thamnocephalis sphaerospora TaxID=78915 RepID=A0A4P9XP38_9FUNG|nr:hypothetical protein THASP1DRAFT_30451 [Thamnocephalis sphaerospora]|eukprot:RKP07745.1 hypothetical protein THASP1DRAFT_30451 [Thamnocephalis sphaerospora]
MASSDIRSQLRSPLLRNSNNYERPTVQSRARAVSGGSSIDLGSRLSRTFGFGQTRANDPAAQTARKNTTVTTTVTAATATAKSLSRSTKVAAPPAVPPRTRPLSAATPKRASTINNPPRQMANETEADQVDELPSRINRRPRVPLSNLRTGAAELGHRRHHSLNDRGPISAPLLADGGMRARLNWHTERMPKTPGPTTSKPMTFGGRRSIDDPDADFDVDELVDGLRREAREDASQLAQHRRRKSLYTAQSGSGAAPWAGAMTSALERARQRIAASKGETHTLRGDRTLPRPVATSANGSQPAGVVTGGAAAGQLSSEQNDVHPHLRQRTRSSDSVHSDATAGSMLSHSTEFQPHQSPSSATSSPHSTDQTLLADESSTRHPSGEKQAYPSLISMVKNQPREQHGRRSGAESPASADASDHSNRTVRADWLARARARVCTVGAATMPTDNKTANDACDTVDAEDHDVGHRRRTSAALDDKYFSAEEMTVDGANDHGDPSAESQPVEKHFSSAGKPTSMLSGTPLRSRSTTYSTPSALAKKWADSGSQVQLDALVSPRLVASDRYRSLDDADTLAHVKSSTHRVDEAVRQHRTAGQADENAGHADRKPFARNTMPAGNTRHAGLPTLWSRNGGARVTPLKPGADDVDVDNNAAVDSMWRAAS